MAGPRRIWSFPLPSPAPIRIGIGGWTYEPWRGSFYPAKLPQVRELEHASRQFDTIEVNGTYYGTQTPETFARWREETPEGFVFSLKAPRFATNRKRLIESAASIARFLESGIVNLKEKLGPINWQFMETKSFDAEDFSAFLNLLPREAGGFKLRHALEVRHTSFRHPEFLALARAHGAAVVVAGDSPYAEIADLTAPFVYARIMGTSERAKHGYPPQALALWAERAQAWARGEAPEGLPYVEPPAPGAAREVFLYVIGGFKEKNPAAATALRTHIAGRPRTPARKPPSFRKPALAVKRRR